MSVHADRTEALLIYSDRNADLDVIRRWSEMHPGSYVTLNRTGSDAQSLVGLTINACVQLVINATPVTRETASTWVFTKNRPHYLTLSGQPADREADSEFLLWMQEHICPSVWVSSGDPW